MDTNEAVEILATYLQQQSLEAVEMRREAARYVLDRVRAGDKTPTQHEIKLALLATGDLDAILIKNEGLNT